MTLPALDYSRYFASTVCAVDEVLTAQEKADMRTKKQILMQFGDPSAELFPNEKVLEALKSAFDREPDKVLQYGSGQSARQLRSFLLERARLYSMEVSDRQLLVTNGSSEGLDLVCRLFLDPGDVLIAEAPTYMGALTTFRNFGVAIEGCDVDEHGLQTMKLESLLIDRARADRRMPKFVYIIPNFQNPTGVTMTASRRRHLLELAERFNLLVVCDDAYQDLRMVGEDVPSLWEMDESGRVICLGTLSKTLAPSLRLGWLFGPEKIIAHLSVLKPGYGNGVAESLAGEYFRLIDFQARLHDLRDFYRERRDAVLHALETYMPADVKWNRPEGGLFIWLELPASLDIKAFIKETANRGVAVLGGPMFYPDGRDTRCVRLSYSLETQERLIEGVQIMSQVISDGR